ncbi:MAG: DUF4421 family protein [Bacteroidetes bacterium]|nr:DUF4421 family protein [Bacteroidota bacterium]
MKARIFSIHASLFILLCCFPFPLLAQNNDTVHIPNLDSIYIEDYTEWLTSRFYVLYQDAQFTISTNEVANIIYKPNTNIKIGIAGFYKWFGLGLSITNPFYQFKESTYGKTTSIDLRINAFGRAVAAEVFIQNFHGFYIRNIHPTYSSYFILPDMNLFSLGAYGYWIYNSRKFSLRAAFVQNERQIKSAGSFMIRPGISFYKVTSDTGIIPGELIKLFKMDKDELLKGGRFYSFSLAPGYAYTLVFLKHAYVNAAAFPGVSWLSYSYEGKYDNYSRSDFVFQLGLRVAIGFNTTRWYIGGALITGFNDLNSSWSNSSFFYDVSQFRFWGGMRFDIFRKKKKNNL